MNINKIAVIGAGTMGNGIAHVFAQNGFSVSLIDVKQEQLNKALSTIIRNLDRQVKKGSATEDNKKTTMQNIATATVLDDGLKDCELIVEAATENIDLKLKLCTDIDRVAPENAIIASNTSSISITQLAAATSRADRFIGMHFMNPVPVMKLVEVINGYHTSPDVTDTILSINEKIGKISCVVNDYPGFIANRILMPMINEAIFSLYEGVAGVAEIDTVMKLGMAHPMGPLQLADFIGLDVCLSILNVLHKGFGNPKYAPCPLLVNMVTAGSLGKKSGAGFYDYSGDNKELKVCERFRK